jgi:hypothetical protein
MSQYQDHQFAESLCDMVDNRDPSMSDDMFDALMNRIIEHDAAHDAALELRCRDGREVRLMVGALTTLPSGAGVIDVASSHRRPEGEHGEYDFAVYRDVGEGMFSITHLRPDMVLAPPGW